jgi:hypothetical protein
MKRVNVIKNVKVIITLHSITRAFNRCGISFDDLVKFLTSQKLFTVLKKGRQFLITFPMFGKIAGTFEDKNLMVIRTFLPHRLREHRNYKETVVVEIDEIILPVKDSPNFKKQEAISCLSG